MGTGPELVPIWLSWSWTLFAGPDEFFPGSFHQTETLAEDEGLLLIVAIVSF